MTSHQIQVKGQSLRRYSIFAWDRRWRHSDTSVIKKGLVNLGEEWWTGEWIGLHGVMNSGHRSTYVMQLSWRNIRPMNTISRLRSGCHTLVVLSAYCPDGPVPAVLFLLYYPSCLPLAVPGCFVCSCMLQQRRLFFPNSVITAVISWPVMQ